MAGTSAENVAVGKPNLKASGGVLVAPVGTTRPTTYAGPYDDAYKSVGYVGEDGVTETSERSTEDIRAWGGDKVRTVQTEFGTTLEIPFIESRNAELLKLVFGEENVEVDDENKQIVVKRNSKTLPHVQMIVDMVDGEYSRHLDVGLAQPTEIDDITYADGEAITYTMTISCDPDADGNTLIERVATGETAEAKPGE